MSMSWPTQSTFCAFYIVKNLIEFGSHWIHIIPGLFMNFFNTDALSGACAGSLLEKIPYAEEKKSGVWDSISRPLPRYAKALPLALFGQVSSLDYIKI